VDGNTQCFPTKKAKTLCPCKASQDTCLVQDYDNTVGKVTADVPKCVARGAQCPCGKNTNSCEDTQDASKKICVPKFSKDGSKCPVPCTPTQVAKEKKATCVQNHLDTSGEPTGASITCVSASNCSAGRGQKQCATGATIASRYSCKDVYGSATTLSRRLSLDARRLAALAAGSKQTVTVSFTLKSLTTAGKTKTGFVKTNLDSLLQLTGSHQSSFSMVVSGSEASVTYKVWNLGAVKVSPQIIATLLVKEISTTNTAMKSALAPIGVAVLGSGGSGCCSVTVDLKTVVDKSNKAQKALLVSTGTTGTTGGTTGGNTTKAIAYTKVEGSLTVVAAGLTKAQIEAASKTSLALHFAVDASKVTATALTHLMYSGILRP